MKRLGLLVFIIALVSSSMLASLVSGKSLLPGMPRIFVKIKGSGIIKSEKRDVPAFKSIDVGGAAEVEVVAGKEQSVVLEADDNILPSITTEVRGDTLHIGRKEGNFRTKNRLRVTISVPELTGMEISGATRANALNIRAENFKLRVSGASKVNVEGEARSLDVDLSGASNIDAENLRTERAAVDASGASKATVFVSDTLNAEASGASRVSYSGNPRNVNKDASGASSVSAR